MTSGLDTAGQLARDGYTILPAVVPAALLTDLKAELPRRARTCAGLMRKAGMNDGGGNVAHHVVDGTGATYDFLQLDAADELIRGYFGGPFILNSFGAVNNAPIGAAGYEHGETFHRDVRTYAGDFHLMLNMIVMVDAFTAENGGTFIVPASHKTAARPPDDDMRSRAIQLVGPAGSVALFDSNVWHAAAPNRTEGSRWALTLTLTRPFMKQQMDYPRLLGDRAPEDPRLKQLLGYNARVPADLVEWYRPAPQRLYQSDQG